VNQWFTLQKGRNKMKFTEKEIKKKLIKDHNISKDWLDKHLTVINMTSKDIEEILTPTKRKEETK
jgi:hypothetical protein|tara:strand:+ start:1069 stop:1263 length:195 start_codon:yes stop_codon:yes gene_type:complete